MISSNVLNIAENNPFKPKASKENYSCEIGSLKFYSICGLGGCLACGITHVVILPLDLVKCRIQVDPVNYPDARSGFRHAYKELGARGLMIGWAPTTFGYCMQGSGKYGLYEVFKQLYAKWIGEENAYIYRNLMYIAAASTAEFIADVSLAPFEAMKVRMQTESGYAKTMRECYKKMAAEPRPGGASPFWKGLPPLWGRMIPYTTAKFLCFERTVEYIYKNIVTTPKDQIDKPTQLAVTFSAGYIAGIVCGIVSHPPDVIVSILNKRSDASLKQVVNELGWSGMWKGLAPRIAMIGTITAMQWFIFDTVKVVFSLPRPPPPSMPASLVAKGYGQNQ